MTQPSTRTGKKSTKKVYSVQDLKEWVTRWPVDGTLGFNPVTREPVVYDRDSGPAEDRVINTTIPWKRRADTLTILSHPNMFSDAVVSAAKQQYEQTRPPNIDINEYQEAETALLEAWRQYEASDGNNKGLLRKQIHAAQSNLHDIEKANANVTHKDRELISIPNSMYQTLFVQPIPIKKRGIKLEAIEETL